MLFFLLTLFGSNTAVSAGIALFGCVLIVVTQTGMEFSDDYHSLREYYSLFGWRYGRWEQLPTIVGVTVKYFSELECKTSGRNSWGIWNNAPRRYERLIIMLSVKNKAVGIIISYFSVDDANAAVDFAHEVADGFGVPVHTFLPVNQFRPL